MIRIALTGSIGMGKSTVARMFEAAGVPVFDADAVVRQLQGPAARWLRRSANSFPGRSVRGRSIATVLPHIVLADPAKLAALEGIVHPAVRDWRVAFVEQHRGAPALLFEIPLLFETDGESEFDKVIVVSAPPGVQRARVLAGGE